jgi:hypothetical protein
VFVPVRRDRRHTAHPIRAEHRIVRTPSTAWRAWVLLFAFGALFGCAAHGARERVVDEYVAALNAGDVDRAMALVDPDVVIVTPAQGRMRGAEALRGVLAWDAATRVRLRMARPRVEDGALVFDDVTETNEFHRRLGVAHSRYAPGTRLRVTNGRIVEITPQPFDDATQQTLSANLARFRDWLRGHDPDAEARLFPDGGRRVYSADSAALWLDYLDRWQRDVAR